MRSPRLVRRGGSGVARTRGERRACVGSGARTISWKADAPSAMRVAVYNRHWATTGGGERFAGGIAQVLAEEHDVSLLAHRHVDLAMMAERLQLDLARVDLRIID